MSNNVQIVIKGHLDPEWADWFGALTCAYDGQDNTILSGSIPDQPALHGILERIRDLNLTLISVHQIEGETDTPQHKEI